MLNEGWPEEPEVEIGPDGEEYEKYHRMFPDKFYLKMFKMIDRDPEYFMSRSITKLGGLNKKRNMISFIIILLTILIGKIIM